MIRVHSDAPFLLLHKQDEHKKMWEAEKERRHQKKLKTYKEELGLIMDEDNGDMVAAAMAAADIDLYNDCVE